MMDFDDAFETVIGHEGGYVNDPRDPGGETKYGISKRSYPQENIRALTLDRAKEIYKRDFWDKVQGDKLPYVVAFALFDAAVNSGVKPAVTWLQRAVGADDDGVLGPKTLKAVSLLEPNATAARLNGYRLDAMTYMKWDTFGKGWARRVAANLKAFPATLASQPVRLQDARYEAWVAEGRNWLKRAPAGPA